LLLSGYGKKKASLVYIIESDNDWWSHITLLMLL
jgi:hypothetical protein